MWQDLNSSVRRVAGQALGKCGCGQAVHEEVVLRLQSRLWQDRVEALKLIGYLGSFGSFFAFQNKPKFGFCRSSHREINATISEMF